MAQEGQTAIGPNGERAVFRGGQWVVVSQAQQMPADPTFPYKGQQAAVDVTKTQTDIVDTQTDNAREDRKVGEQIETERVSRRTAGLPEGWMWDAQGGKAVPIPGYSRQGLSPEIRSQALQAFSDADALERAATELEQLYKTGPGATSGIYGIQDYLPTDANKVFNDAGQQARGYVKRSLGFTGGEGNTVAESSALYDPYLPSASDRDVQIEAKIKKLRGLANDSRAKATRTLGGVPDASGNITPLNAMTAPRTVSGDPLQAAAFGATTGVDQYPPEMLQAHEALVGRLVMQGGGRIDPQAYATERAKLDQQFGFATNEQSNAAWATGINDYIAKGGKSVPTDIQPPERELSDSEWLRNSAVNNPIGAGVAGYADMMGMGGVSALAGDDMQALGDQGGWTGAGMTLGQIGGSISGAGLVGKLGANTFGKIAPSLLGGGGRSALAREVGTDAVYSGIVGTNQGGDPLTSAALGVGGTLAGRGVGKGLAKLAGGVSVAPAVAALRARGIPLTGGQALGGIAKSLEDKATSIPLVGDIINARRKEGLEAFNREAFQQAGAPINARVSKIGDEGVQALFDQAGNAYDSATAGVRVPLDPQFAQDFAQITAAGQRLPDDLRSRFGLALNNRVNPINDAGELTGDTYQQAVRGLKSYKAENVKPGFEQDYRDGLTGAINALKGQMQRGGGQGVVDGLAKADEAYRNIKMLEDATGRADGAGYVFTPSQLQDAAKKAQKQFPGKRTLYDLADEGQEVLPSMIPDSGTAGRMAAMGGGLLTGGAALGGAYGASGGGGFQGAQDGALAGGINSALLTGLLLAGGTKRGQKAITKALLDRPQALQTAGSWLNTRGGLFGRGVIPLALSAQ